MLPEKTAPFARQPSGLFDTLSTHTHTDKHERTHSHTLTKISRQGNVYDVVLECPLKYGADILTQRFYGLFAIPYNVFGDGAMQPKRNQAVMMIS